MGNVLGELRDSTAADEGSRDFREDAAEMIEEVACYQKTPADEGIGEPGGEDGAGDVVEGPNRRKRNDIAGRALKHDDVRGLLCEVRKEGNGGRAAANDDDLLVRVVQVFRPELRMHDGTLEILETRNGCLKWLIVVVIARGHDHERRIQSLPCAIPIDVQ